MGENAMIKCPKCGSTNVTCMDGAGAVSKYGRNVMIDIAFDMWLCGDCGESFRSDESEFYKENTEKAESNK